MSNSQSTQQSQASSAKEPDPDAIKMFVGQIPRTWGEAECRNLFEQYGSVCHLNVLRDKLTHISRGCCFVTFYKRADAIAAQAALHNIRILPQMCHPVQMKPADIENRNVWCSSSRCIAERKLFIGMLNKKLTEVDVREMFEHFGHIEDCTVLRDPEGKSRGINAGCAFVTFAHRSCAQQAIRQVHLSQIMEGCSKPIVVKFADTQKEKDAKRMNAASLGTTPALPNVKNFTNTLQQVLQTPQPSSTTNPALGAQLAALASILQTASHSNVLSLIGNVLSGLGRLTENATSSNQTSITSSPFPLVSQQTLASLSSSPGLSNADSSAAFQQQQQQQLAVLQHQQRLLDFFNPSFMNPSQAVANGSFVGENKLNGVTGNNNLIQLTGQNTSNGMDVMQRAYAGLQHYAGFYPQLPTGSLLTTASTSGAAMNIISSGQSKGPDGCNLFIYHLPQDFTDNDLFTTFAPFGTIISAKVFIDKQTNLSKCFGFVSFDNAVSARNAISALNGFQIGSKRLKVQLKRGKDSKPYSHSSMSVTSDSSSIHPLST
ncbi:unnamed protein product [Thelazia callipaeda]|uniref:CUGBP Elav-like family member 2 n=1 Tax=Thelazia callipaeda TaxID=103827 RepID=A0A0N5D290_THECL|nr:unnamed protein product [Thelazia callipaeda]